jgi:DNA-binding Lrp family transcriptional regulator
VNPSNQVKVSQEVIAHMMGVSRQSANKAMKTLEELGLISRSYGVVVLNNKSHITQSIGGSVQVDVIVRRFKRDETGPETVF